MNLFRRRVAILVCVALVIASIVLTALVYAVSGGTVILLLLPIVAPSALLALWALGRSGGPGTHR